MKQGSGMTNSYISLYIHIVFNRPDGTFVLSYLHPAMNRRAIVTDALSWGIRIGLSYFMPPRGEGSHSSPQRSWGGILAFFEELKVDGLVKSPDLSP